MIIKEQEIKNKLKTKGELVAIDDDGMHIEDDKSGVVETLSLDDLKFFIGKTITITVADSTKFEVDDFNDKVNDDDGEEDEE